VVSPPKISRRRGGGGGSVFLSCLVGGETQNRRGSGSRKGTRQKSLVSPRAVTNTKQTGKAVLNQHLWASWDVGQPSRGRRAIEENSLWKSPKRGQRGSPAVAFEGGKVSSRSWGGGVCGRVTLGRKGREDPKTLAREGGRQSAAERMQNKPDVGGGLETEKNWGRNSNLVSAQD